MRKLLIISSAFNYFFLDTDVEYVQDGTRLGKESRPMQRDFFLKKLGKEEVPFSIIKGKWQERFDRMVNLINQFRQKKLT